MTLKKGMNLSYLSLSITPTFRTLNLLRYCYASHTIHLAHSI